MLNKIYNRCPNARIVLMIPPFRKDMTANGQGLVLEDYRNAIRKVAYNYGYPLIDLKQLCGINQSNVNYFYQDVVHPNSTTGGKRLAEVIGGFLKTIEPLI